MYLGTYLKGIVFFIVIPGVVCKYEYSVGGMVASALAGFLLLLIIIVMALFASMWQSWYRKRQAKRGYRRIQRRHWTLFKRKSKPELLPSPRSEKKIPLMQLYNTVPGGGSRNTTLTRERSTGAWVTHMPPGDQYEEKVKSLDFDQEDEAVIVADILPDENTTRLGVNEHQNVTYVQNTTNMRDSHLQMGLSSTQFEPPTQEMLGGNEVYHVRLSAMSARSSKPNNTYISPPFPTSDQPELQADVVNFADSDDEAGNIPNQTEDVILF